MITKEDTYKKAFENKNARFKEKQRRYEMLLASAYASVPRLAEIDREMSSIGANIAITALSGDMEKLSSLKQKSEALTLEKKVLLDKTEIAPLSYECAICQDTGYVSGKICECIRKEASKVMAKELSKEMPLGECGFCNFSLDFYPEKTADGKLCRKKIEEIFIMCKEYADNFDSEASPNLLFTGGVGLGKTHLTLSIVSEIVKKGFMPVYGSAENIFSVIENEKFSGEGKGSYDSVLNCDLLVIDDLGVEMATSFTKSVLYNLVNTRLLSRKPTIINTNLTMKEIEARYTQRITSRFIGNYDEYRFTGNDIRLQKLIKSKKD